MLLTMVMKPAILFKKISLKEGKVLQENTGKPLMISNKHFLEQQRSFGPGQPELFSHT